MPPVDCASTRTYPARDGDVATTKKSNLRASIASGKYKVWPQRLPDLTRVYEYAFETTQQLSATLTAGYVLGLDEDGKKFPLTIGIRKDDSDNMRSHAL
ncbi:predicted protein [Pyrenophora tritici-repentis Pt-1C-BFP]|uniref:Uncharacterized protein n=1 Tax=Pyrenophora tritici-repentis (strain Pt-1C-BFP) TaxID=426418 RepID=B2W0E9_PYRTR|nr:uncharacterized protein PTRG_03934 [Pyrenophora tritici-repentis Pt-1C-BFP]EDU46772.1 predicted protein [Pyrenophora tritici-repentis Pt-1C-BFP]